MPSVKRAFHMPPFLSKKVFSTKAGGERNRISLRKAQATRRKENAAGIPPKMWVHLLPPMPMLTSTIYRHYKQGPPARSWSLSFDLAVSVVRDFLKRSSDKTVEDVQALTTSLGIAAPSDVKRTKVWVPQHYREKAGMHLEKQFTSQEMLAIGWDWRADRERVSEMRGEWIDAGQNKIDSTKPVVLYLHGGAYYLCSYKMYRPLLSKIAKMAEASTFAVNYRLAPQHPFPAAVEDALAAYIYLIQEEGIAPERIVLGGDSAGGGLSCALLLAIRDAGLTPPAGAFLLSPWVDLTHSLPSIIENLATDYLPSAGFKHLHSPALDYTQLPRINSDDKWEGEVEKDLDRIQFYCDNRVLKHPLVSPVFDKKQLRGLPPLLVQTGTAERLRDESLYLALQASAQLEPGQENNKDRATPVQLELYVDQPHVFQIMLPTRCSVKAIANMARFVKDHSVKEDVLTVHTITPRGETMETTKSTVRPFMESDVWKRWQERLERSSLKARLDEVYAATRAEHAKVTPAH